MKRLIDIFIAISVVIVFCLPALAICLTIRLTSPGPIIHWSTRVGRYNKAYRMPKFRTMLCETPMLPTHALPNPDRWLTPAGSFLRKSSLDELPQVWSVLKGDMSFVGPRPVLAIEKDLVDIRTSLDVHKLIPGITGWAQVNGRDSLSAHEKAAFDAEYLDKQSLGFDFAIMRITIVKVLNGSGIRH
jgi:O-antigen biosynthesis protein WbqP